MTTTAIHREHAIFRVVLQAVSHPGIGYALPVSCTDSDSQTLLLHMLGCLMDNEVAFSIIGDDSDSLADALSFRTGSARVGISDADFIIAPQGTSDGQLPLIKRGTLEYPDKGATVVYLIDTILDVGGRALLTGPGVKGTVRPMFIGLADGELSGLREVNAEYPLGVDVILLDAEGRIASIPRSTRIGAH